MTESSTSGSRIVRVKHGPPANEVPAAVATPHIIMWRGDGIAVAIPSLLAYTTGLEIQILGRLTEPQPRTIEHAQELSGILPRRLLADGRPVQLLGGDHNGHGFTYRAWVPFAGGAAPAEITFTLDWPGIEESSHRVGRITAASNSAVTLWPS
jgi:hypothetical protein